MTRQFNLRLSPLLLDRVRRLVGPTQPWRTVTAFIQAAIARMIEQEERALGMKPRRLIDNPDL